MARRKLVENPPSPAADLVGTGMIKARMEGLVMKANVSLNVSRGVEIVYTKRHKGRYYKTLWLFLSTISEGQRAGQSGSPECFFAVMVQGKGQPTARVIKLLDMPTTSRKALPVMCLWAATCLVI